MLNRRPSRTTVTTTALGLIVLAAVCFWLSSDAREVGLAVNTLYLVGWTCVIAVPIGTWLALLIARTDLPGRRVFAVIIAIMLFMPLYTQTAAWQAGFGQQGWFSLLYSRLGEAPLLDGWRGAIWIHALAAIPWVTVIVALALRNIEPQLEEAALLDGSPWQVLLAVTLPRSGFAIFAAVIWVAVQTAGEFTVTDMWWLRTYAEDIFRGFAVGDTPEEVAIGLLPTVIASGLLIAGGLIVLQHWMTGDAISPTRSRWTFRLAASQWPTFVFAVIVMLCLIGVPLSNLLVQLGHKVTHATDGTIQRGWSLSLAAENLYLSVWEFRRELIWSLGTGTIAAFFAVILAIPIAWLARGRGWRTWPAVLIAAIYLTMPGPLLGICLAWLFNAPNWHWLNLLYDRSITAPTVALTLRALPLVIIVIWYALRSVPQSTLDSASLDGAGFWRQLMHVALPQRKAAIVAAWLVGVAIAIGDLSASFLVLPAGASPLSRRIFEEVHYGVPGRVAGITLVTMLMVSAIVVTAVVAGASSHRRET